MVLAAALTGVGMLASVVLVAAGNESLVDWVSGGLCGVAGGGRRGGAALPPVRPGPHHQPHAGHGLLTVLLGLGYAGVVLGLGRLLPQGSSLVVAAATLAVAAVFQPARRRIQAGAGPAV